MATLTCILGLCGSGKSYLADQFEKAGARKFDEGFGFDPVGNVQKLANVLNAGGDCVLVEIGLCDPRSRDWIVAVLGQLSQETKIEWIAFEPDLTAANENCQRRKNKADAAGHIEINSRVATVYTIPAGVVPRPIHRLSEEGG